MAVRYTEEQLNTVDKSLLIQMFLNQQEQLQTLTAEVCSLNEKMQLMMEQMVLANRNRFGRSSEKMADASQISFREVDGTIVFFNEAEAVCDLDAPEPEHLEESAPRPVKKRAKRTGSFRSSDAPDRSLFSTLTVTICTASPPASLMGLRMNHVLTYFCSQKAKHYPEWLQLFKNIWFCLRQNITLFPQQFAITWYTIIYCHTIFIS